MPKKVRTETRQALLKAIGDRYRAGTKDVKLRILDEFVAITGYHRKHAIRLFNAVPRASESAQRPRLRLYDDAVREALIVLWEASDRVCGKRLKALLPIFLVRTCVLAGVVAPGLEKIQTSIGVAFWEKTANWTPPGTSVAPSGV